MDCSTTNPFPHFKVITEPLSLRRKELSTYKVHWASSVLSILGVSQAIKSAEAYAFMAFLGLYSILNSDNSIAQAIILPTSLGLCKIFIIGRFVLMTIVCACTTTKQTFYIGFDVMLQSALLKHHRPTTMVQRPMQNGLGSTTGVDPKPMQSVDYSTSVIR